MKVAISFIVLLVSLAWMHLSGAAQDSTPARKRTLESFKKSLDKSMTPAKTIAAFGEPDRKLGSGLIIYEYDLHDGSTVRLGFPGFAPIQYARHLRKGGESEDIPLK